MNKFIIPVTVVLLITLGCKGQPAVLSPADQKIFGDYWFQGKAEISTYELSQSRYGAIHDGNVVLIFVTEDHDSKKQVKPDDHTRNPAGNIPVMKLNTMKEFVTGIYKYSMMSSVFTPLDYRKHPHSLKLTSGSQDWCGQSFMQANWKGNRYEVHQNSYFESVGDNKYSLMNPILEDEIWTKIRIAPHTLPVGEMNMVASSFFIRLSHQPNKVYKANATLQKDSADITYQIEYPELKRTIAITFQAGFPYKITKWVEKYGEGEMTSAILKSTIMSDYWNHHFPKDEMMRKEIGID